MFKFEAFTLMMARFDTTAILDYRLFVRVFHPRNTFVLKNSFLSYHYIRDKEYSLPFRALNVGYSA